METRKSNRRLHTPTRTVGCVLLRGAVAGIGTLEVQLIWQSLVM